MIERKPEDDLEFYFGSYAALSGLHAAALSGPGASGVWDDARQRMEHARLLVLAHSVGPKRLRAIAARLARLSPADRTTLLISYSPRKWGAHLPTPPSKRARDARDSEPAPDPCPDPASNLHSELRWQNASLVGLVLTGTAIVKLWVKRETSDREAKAKGLMKRGEYAQVIDLCLRPVEPSMLDLLALLNAAARMDAGSRRAIFEPLIREAKTRLSAALAAYGAIYASDRAATLEAATKEPWA
jgi:hypothetical protein